MSFIQVGHELQQKLAQIYSKLENKTQLTSTLERVLVSQTLQNFDSNGRPEWAGLSLKTLESYRRQGIVPKGILQRSPGGLRDSVVGDHDQESAMVGAGSGKSKDYAAIHQWGGTTRPHIIRAKTKKALAFSGGIFKQVNHPGSKIPARPYLPITANGDLQVEAENAVVYTADQFLRQAFQ